MVTEFVAKHRRRLRVVWVALAVGVLGTTIALRPDGGGAFVGVVFLFVTFLAVHLLLMYGTFAAAGTRPFIKRLGILFIGALSVGAVVALVGLAMILF